MKIKQLISSFRYAFRGTLYVFRHEQNFRLQLLASIAVIFLMFVFELRRSEIVVLLLLIFAVLVLELLNSAMELFVDLLKPRLHKQVEVVKDVMAAMVLITAFASIIIGIIIFWPHIIELV